MINRPACSGLQTSCPRPQTERRTTNCKTTDKNAVKITAVLPVHIDCTEKRTASRRKLTGIPGFLFVIAQFPYIKIQLKTIDITARPREIINGFIWVYSPKPRNDAYCFRLNFNISKLGYYDNDTMRTSLEHYTHLVGIFVNY